MSLSGKTKGEILTKSITFEKNKTIFISIDDKMHKITTQENGEYLYKETFESSYLKLSNSLDDFFEKIDYEKFPELDYEEKIKKAGLFNMPLKIKIDIENQPRYKMQINRRSYVDFFNFGNGDIELVFNFNLYNSVGFCE